MGIQHEMNMRNLKRYGADGRKKGVRHQAGPIWRPIRVDGGVSSWLLGELLKYPQNEL